MRIQAKIIVHNYELKERRMNLGYTQQDFADIIGIDPAKYSNIELMKKKPTEELARLMAIELDTDVDTLFPQGYERLVETLANVTSVIKEFTPPLLENYEEKLLLESIDAKLTVKHLLKNCHLKPKERKIIEMRNGLGEFNGVMHTLEEVGREFGVTRERIRHIEAITNSKIRESIDIKDLQNII